MLPKYMFQKNTSSDGVYLLYSLNREWKIPLAGTRVSDLKGGQERTEKKERKIT